MLVELCRKRLYHLGVRRVLNSRRHIVLSHQTMESQWMLMMAGEMMGAFYKCREVLSLWEVTRRVILSMELGRAKDVILSCGQYRGRNGRRERKPTIVMHLQDQSLRESRCRFSCNIPSRIPRFRYCSSTSNLTSAAGNACSSRGCDLGLLQPQLTVLCV